MSLSKSLPIAIPNRNNPLVESTELGQEILQGDGLPPIVTEAVPKSSPTEPVTGINKFAFWRVGRTLSDSDNGEEPTADEEIIVPKSPERAAAETQTD